MAGQRAPLSLSLALPVLVVFLLPPSCAIVFSPEVSGASFLRRGSLLQSSDGHASSDFALFNPGKAEQQTQSDLPNSVSRGQLLLRLRGGQEDAKVPKTKKNAVGKCKRSMCSEAVNPGEPCLDLWYPRVPEPAGGRCVWLIVAAASGGFVWANFVCHLASISPCVSGLQAASAEGKAEGEKSASAFREKQLASARTTKDAGNTAFQVGSPFCLASLTVRVRD
eukprot:2265039-Rhodomonas_salina.2